MCLRHDLPDRTIGQLPLQHFQKSNPFWKDYFIAVLSGTAATFHLHLWCQVILRSEKQFLILRQPNVNKNILPYAHLHCNYDYYALHFVPIGMESLIHKKLIQSKTWDKNAVKGWCLAPPTSIIVAGAYG